MTIHDIAINVLDRIIQKVDANQQATGHWWDTEPFVYIEPTEQEMRSKLASIERRLQKAETGLEDALSPDELAWHRFLKTDPKSMDDVQKRKQTLAKLYEVLDRDEHKLTLYRQYKKLEEQRSNLNRNLNHSEFESFDLQETLDAKSTHSFQLVIDWPDEVEDSKTAGAITTLIHTALHNAGYSYQDYGFTSPIAYFDKGKLALEIDDEEERFRFNTAPLDEINWRKIRDALVKLKAEVESPQGWKRRPSSRHGETLERIAPADDLQMELLEKQITSDWNDTSHWDTWRPDIPGRKRVEALSIIMCDHQGKELDISGLRDLSLQGLAEPGDDDGHSPDVETQTGESFELDSSALCKKATLRADAARHYLENYLGVKGLALPPESQQHGQDRTAFG